MHDRSGGDRRLVPTTLTLQEFACCLPIEFIPTTAWTNESVRPSGLDEVVHAGFLGGEALLELEYGAWEGWARHN